MFGRFWTTHRNHPCLQRIFDLLRPVVTGLVAVAGIMLIVNSLWDVDSLSLSLIETRPDIPALVIAAMAFSLTAFTQVSPVRIVFAGLVAGLLVGMMG
jgi:chromate transport protein ChrA